MSWRGLDHRTIYEMVVNGGKGPGMSMEAERRWANIQKTISDAEHSIAAAVRESAAEWEGGGGGAMRSAYTPLGAWALNAAVSAHITATGVRGQGELAMNTRMHVADNAPPQNFGEYLHDQLGSWDGHTVYDDQAAAVDRLMGDYENASVDNEQRFDSWSVPPTVVVTPAAVGPTGPGGPGAGPMTDTTGVGPSGGGGSGTAAALAPGAAGGAVGSGAGGPGPGSVPPSAGAPSAGSVGSGVGPGTAGVGPVPGVGSSASGGAGGAGRGPGMSGSGVGGPTGGGVGAGPGAVGAGGVGGSGAADAGTRAPGPVGPGAAGRAAGPGTGGVARPSMRPPGSSGGSGTGAGPWTRAATGAGRSPAVAGPFRPVVPAVPPRTSTPGWRSVLLPPEREAAATGRAPGETAARGAGPGSPGGTTATPAAAQGSGARASGSPGMHGAPMMGGGAGGVQPEGRRRASYLIDDSDAFVDKRWFTEPVITPDDPL